jgi:hypothetical protein
VFLPGHRPVTETLLDLVHLQLDAQQIGECGARFVEDRAPRMRQAVLGQVSDGQRRRFDDGAAVRLVEAGKHLQQRRFPCAVGAAETHAFAC